MKLEGLFVYLIIFSISLTLLGSGLFDSLKPQYLTGESISLAAQKCSDGTVYGKCSATKPLYCSQGTLIDNCSKCGCPNNMTCTSFGSCNTIPSILNPTIASVDGSNLAGKALNCSGRLIDSDNDSLNVTVLWSLNNASNYSFGYNNNYPNGTRFSATLGGGSITAGFWFCQITVYDGKNYSTNRSNSLQIKECMCSDGTLCGYCSVTLPNYCQNGVFVNNCSVCGCPIGLSCNSTSNACYTVTLPPQNCSDGTLHGQCSATKPKYCRNGALVDNCTSCGCPADYSCNTTSNTCFASTCSDGTLYGQCSVTKPKYCQNGTLVNNCSVCGCPTGQLCNSTTAACYISTCSDGTVYGNCSSSRPKYCSNGTLIDKCTICGCPAGQSCNSSNGACYVPMCSDGTLYNLCSVTKPKYCSNDSLIDNCTNCGCPTGQLCNVTSNACYTPLCSDGTLYGQCSVTKPKYCQNGTLVNNCTQCDCPPTLSCNPLNNSCYVPNNPPTVSPPAITSTFGTNTTNEDLSCISQVADLDGDTMNVTVNWYKNDEITVTVMYKNMENGTLRSLLKSSNLSVGDWWQCDVFVWDGKNATKSDFSNKIKILSPPAINAPPHAPAPLLDSSDGTNSITSNLNCHDTIMDPNGDKMNVTAVWVVNGTPAMAVDYNQSLDSGSLFNAVLLSSNLSIGDTWACRIRLYDGTNYSDWGVSNSLTIVAPVTPTPQPPSQQPPSGGGAPSPAPPSSGGTSPNATAPTQPMPVCTSALAVTMPEEIYIPQMVSKQLSIVVTNKGTCPIPSIAAALTLPLGMKSNLYILDKGLEVNESQTITITILPSDAPPGQYSATVKLDAPNISVSKSAKLLLLENPSHVATIGGVSELKVFEYIILLILLEFIFGSAILLVWYGPRKEEDEIPEPYQPKPPLRLK